MLYSSQKGVRTDCPDPLDLVKLECLGCSPEPLERFAIGRFSQLLKCPFSNLPDALARDSHQRADLLERHRLAALFEPVIEIENLALARREILVEDPIDEFAHQLGVGALFDLAAFLAGEALAERRGVLVGAIDRRGGRCARSRRSLRGPARFRCRWVPGRAPARGRSLCGSCESTGSSDSAEFARCAFVPPTLSALPAAPTTRHTK